jgi:hypothetical protein
MVAGTLNFGLGDVASDLNFGWIAAFNDLLSKLLLLYHLVLRLYVRPFAV